MATARAYMVAARASKKPAVASAGDTGCAQSQQREDRGLPGAGVRAGARGRKGAPLHAVRQAQALQHCQA